MSQTHSPTSRSSRPSSVAKRFIISLGVTIMLVFTVRTSLADHYLVPTGSMEPTVVPGDRIFVSKLSYGVRLPLTSSDLAEFSDPVRGDVVVLTSPVDGVTLVKRVVAVPGDTVAVRDGRLLLDGAAVPVTPTSSGWIEHLDTGPHPVSFAHGGGPDFGPTFIPAEHYLVMGDNRGNSLDGRRFGLVHRDVIFGEALGVFMSDGDFEWRDL